MDVIVGSQKPVRLLGRLVTPPRLGELLTWLAYTLLLARVISKHEPWFDEAQAWLLARDARPIQLLTHNLRYEGTPGLWHYLLLIPAKSGLPYGAMNWLAGCLATVGTLVFLVAAPFPRWVRYLFSFSFFPFYQYAVVARSYVLLPLLLYGVAAIYRRADQQIALFTLLIGLLANVSLHGTLLAGALSLSFALETCKSWSRLSPSEQRNRLAFFAVLVVVAFLLGLQLRMAADLVGFGKLNLSVVHLAQVSALKLRDTFTGTFILSLPVLAVSMWWFHRRNTLRLFIFGMAGLLALAGVAYSNVWHEGSLLLWWVFVLWISWPREPNLVPRPVTVCWIIILAVHLFWSVRTSSFDLRFPYSGSEAAARFIQSRGLYRDSIFAFGPKSAAILPYFKEVIFKNWTPGQGFWLWSTSNRIDASFAEIARLRPQFVVLSITRDGDDETIFHRRYLRQEGYELRNRFDGALYWKSWILEGDFYELYQDAGKVSCGNDGRRC